jgi:hypothetical protein
MAAVNIIIWILYIIYFEHCTCKIEILILYIPLYLCLPEDGDLSLKHVGGFMFMYNLILLWHMLVCEVQCME